MATKAFVIRAGFARGALRVFAAAALFGVRPDVGWAAGVAEDNGSGAVSVQCDLWAQPMGTLGGMWQFSGTVTGRGPDEAAAREDAERRKWGNMPYLRNCRVLPTERAGG